MTIKLPELPYAFDALSPHMSKATMEYHYGKHHRGYVDKINKLIDRTKYQEMPLAEIVVKAYQTKDESVFNNAAQALNHEFLWYSMSPQGGAKPEGALLDAIAKEFGGFDSFKKAFREAANNHFGSGWVWLVAAEDGLTIKTTSNADTPVARGEQPLLTLDLWEHAYYLDYQNDQGHYVETFLEHLVNWDYAARNYSRLKKAA